MFIICELCERTTQLFNETDDIMCQLNWYYFPYGVQKLLPAILAMSQKPCKIECYGSITCSRDTFKKVGFDKKKEKNKQLLMSHEQ